MPNFPYYEVRKDAGVEPAFVQLEIQAGGTDLDPKAVIDAVKDVLQAASGSGEVTAARYDVTGSDI
jgi:hypothetical protein